MTVIWAVIIDLTGHNISVLTSGDMIHVAQNSHLIRSYDLTGKERRLKVVVVGDMMNEKWGNNLISPTDLLVHVL